MLDKSLKTAKRKGYDFSPILTALIGKSNCNLLVDYLAQFEQKQYIDLESYFRNYLTLYSSSYQAFYIGLNLIQDVLPLEGKEHRKVMKLYKNSAIIEAEQKGIKPFPHS